jgi:unsaturated rhamnogalacturonyl hydrolase
MKLNYIFLVGLIGFIAGCKTPVLQAGQPSLKGESVPVNGKWSQRMAMSILKRNPWMLDTTGAGWGYTQGLVYFSLEQLARQHKETKYKDVIHLYGKQMIAANGKIKGFNREEFNLDNINAGKILFGLYQETGEQRYKLALDRLREQLTAQPRTSEGGYWHKQKYPWQMWLDGAYMASPFLAQYAATFNEPKAFDEVALQFLLMEKHLRDEKTGLLYHGWDESKSQTWANKQNGRSPNFWGRAIGWYAMALVDALDYFPPSHSRRKELVRILQQLSNSLQTFQDRETGLWYQVVDQGTRKGNYLEGSASSMFVYALAKGVRKGYLDNSFLAVAQKGYDGIINQLIAVKENGEVDLLQVCEVAGLSADRDGSYDYYVNEKIRVNDPKGTGPFILASLELNR